jgi:hypothetical protein
LEDITEGEGDRSGGRNESGQERERDLGNVSGRLEKNEGRKDFLGRKDEMMSADNVCEPK